jgi:hypothetical protein
VQEMTFKIKYDAAVPAMDAYERRFGLIRMEQRYVNIPNSKFKDQGNDTRRPKVFIVNDVQHLENNIKNVVRMVISEGCAKC